MLLSEKMPEGQHGDILSAVLAMALGTMIVWNFSPEVIVAEQKPLPEAVATSKAEMSRGTMGVDMSGFKEKRGEDQ